MRGNKFEISTFVCMKCGNKQYLPRPLSYQRKENHRKRIYCVKCCKRVNHIEHRYFDFATRD